MRGFIATLVIFSLIVCGLFFYSDYISSSFSELSSILEHTENELEEENFRSALRYAELFHEKLKQKSYILYYFADRHPINDIITESARLKSFIKSEDGAEAGGVLSGLKIMIEKIVEKSQLKIYNIL